METLKNTEAENKEEIAGMELTPENLANTSGGKSHNGTPKYHEGEMVWFYYHNPEGDVAYGEIEEIQGWEDSFLYTICCYPLRKVVEIKEADIFRKY